MNINLFEVSDDLIDESDGRKSVERNMGLALQTAMT